MQESQAMPSHAGTYLFSIDLEDVRLLMPDGERHAERVPQMTDRYLEWLALRDARCTFFVVGDQAERYPELIAQIAHAGHEIACHTSTHAPLTTMNAETFRADLRRNVELIERCGVARPVGFRAPVFSLTQQTSWAHEVLADEGFIYSSSVLPAASPLFGWPGFGQAPRRMQSGIVELPMSLARIGTMHIPIAGGVYFRALPGWLVKRRMRRVMAHNKPLLGYFHPYDIDTGQERFMHPGINNSRFYNWLMYRNRAGMLDRLDNALGNDTTIMTYRDHVASLEGIL